MPTIVDCEVVVCGARPAIVGPYLSDTMGNEDLSSVVVAVVEVSDPLVGSAGMNISGVGRGYAHRSSTSFSSALFRMGSNESWGSIICSS